MSAIIIFKNNTSESEDFVGKTVSGHDEYIIPEAEQIKWANDNKVLSWIMSQDVSGNFTYDALIGDGSQYLNTSEAVSYLKGIDTSPKHPDGRLIVHQTPRPRGTFTYYTNAGDRQDSPTYIGGNTALENRLNFYMPESCSGDDDFCVRYLDLNTIENPTYIYEGLAQWKDCYNDFLCFEVVSKVCDFVSGASGTYFNALEDGTVIPANGDGTINITNPILVEMVPNEYGDFPPGLWDADYDSVSGFYNIRPNLSYSGQFNMFIEEKLFSRFGNQLCFLGNGSCAFPSNDQSQIGHNMRFKITAKTNITQYGPHEWWANINVTMFRNKTA